MELTERKAKTVIDLVEGPQTPAWQAFCETVAAVDSGHEPYAAIVCGAIAAAGGSTDGDLVAAVAIGTEVACRIRTMLDAQPSVWDVVAVAERFGTVTAVARLLHLTSEQITMALGIAGGQSAGLASVNGTWAGALIRGRAAADGVEACYLARDGYDASTQIIEGAGGAFDVLFPDVSTASITAELGSRWCLECVAPATCIDG
jgi:2-methylcitrate dehydratase PrpD